MENQKLTPGVLFQEEIVVARNLMPYLHHSPMEILTSELHVVIDGLDKQHQMAVMYFPDPQGMSLTTLFVIIERRDDGAPDDSLVIMRNPPLTVDPKMLMLVSPGKRYEFLQLLLEWFQR